jgi:chromate transporter
MAAPQRTHRLTETFLVFLRLGCTSFGGPIAHLGYFQRELVERRRWCSQQAYAETVALAQALPGPASSQVGFALGLQSSGLAGGLAAWCGFTLPSALLMLAFAYGHALFAGPVATRALHGLELVAVAVVAQAIFAMQRSLAPDVTRIVIALLAAATALFVPGQFASLLAIGLGAVAGLLRCRTSVEATPEAPPSPLSKRAGGLAALLFGLLLLTAEVVGQGHAAGLASVVAAFYRSGALVFGGGHVVLPLLENAVVAPGWVTQTNFLAGYGAAQALPGPLFSFGGYLGAAIGLPLGHSVAYSIAGLLGIFTPGLLAMAAVLPFWSALRNRPPLRAALRGINAAVIGLLLAALVRPLAAAALHSIADISLALAALLLLTWSKVPAWAIVLAGALLCVLFKPL